MGAVAFGSHFGVTRADGVFAYTTDLGVEFDGEAWDRWWVGAGFCMSGVHFRAPGVGVRTSHSQLPQIGVMLRQRYALTMGGLRLLVGPGVHLWNHTREVFVQESDGRWRKAFDIPWYVATFTVELQALY